MQLRGWLVGALALVVFFLDTGYLVGQSWAAPYTHAPAGGSTAFPVDVGVTRFMDIQIPPDRERLGPKLTRVDAVGTTPGLEVRFVTTTFDQIGQSSSGFPLRCAQGVNRPVASTPLSRSADTVLRLIFTPTKPGTYHLKGFDLHWQAGIFHGHTFSPLDITVRAGSTNTYDGC